MLTLCYLGETNKFNLETGLNLLAVRKPPQVIPSYFVHVPQLSPSKELFFQTQEWKRKYENKALWWDWYVEIFSKEMKERKDLVRALIRLEQVLQEGKEVRLFCYCKEVQFCHRSLIGKEMVKRGFEVDFRSEKRIEQLSLF